MSADSSVVQGSTRAEKQRVYRRAWVARNPEKDKAAHKRYADDNRDYYRSKWREYYARNRERLLAARQKRRPTHKKHEEAYRVKVYSRDRAKLLFRGARNRAKLCGIEFDLTYADIVIPPTCPVFGVPFNLEGKRGDSRYSPTVDRIDPKKGYVRGNIIVVCFRANQIKSDACASEIRAVADFYAKLEAEREAQVIAG